MHSLVWAWVQGAPKRSWLSPCVVHFPGAELVKWLTASPRVRHIANEDEAIMYGQSLLDCGIIHHVFDKLHSFEVIWTLSQGANWKLIASMLLSQNDANTPYRFRVDDGTFLDPRLTQDVREWGMRLYLRLHGAESVDVRRVLEAQGTPVSKASPSPGNSRSQLPHEDVSSRANGL